MKIIVWFLVLFSCASCNKNPFKGEHRIVGPFPKEITFEGENLAIDAPGMVDLAIADTILFARLSENPDALLSAFSMKDLRSLGPLVVQGKGPNEFLSVTMPMQFQVDTSGIKMWGFDYDRSDLYLMNVSKTIKKHHPVIEKRFNLGTLPFMTDWIYVNDSLLWGVSFSVDNLELISSDIKKQIIIYREPLFESSPILSRDTHALSHISAVKPDLSKIVVGMVYLNQLQIISLNEPHERFSFSISKKAVSFEQINENMNEAVCYYRDVRVTDQLIFAFYSGLSSKEHAKTNSTIIHVFDWNGNTKAVLKLPRYTSYFAIDKNNGCLYGLSSDDEAIYKYDLTDILNE